MSECPQVGALRLSFSYAINAPHDQIVKFPQGTDIFDADCDKTSSCIFYKLEFASIGLLGAV
jgi:hypothetical protein